MCIFTRALKTWHICDAHTKSKKKSNYIPHLAISRKIRIWLPRWRQSGSTSALWTKPSSDFDLSLVSLFFFYYSDYSCQIKFHKSVFAALHGEKQLPRSKITFSIYVWNLIRNLFSPLSAVQTLWIGFFFFLPSEFAEQRFSLCYVFDRVTVYSNLWTSPRALTAYNCADIKHLLPGSAFLRRVSIRRRCII